MNLSENVCTDPFSTFAGCVGVLNSFVGQMGSLCPTSMSGSRLRNLLAAVAGRSRRVRMGSGRVAHLRTGVRGVRGRMTGLHTRGPTTGGATTGGTPTGEAATGGTTRGSTRTTRRGWT